MAVLHSQPTPFHPDHIARARGGSFRSAKEAGFFQRHGSHTHVSVRLSRSTSTCFSHSICSRRGPICQTKIKFSPNTTKLTHTVAHIATWTCSAGYIASRQLRGRTGDAA